MLQFDFVYNLNMILLYLLLNALYMAVFRRKMLIAIRWRDITKIENLIGFLLVAILQAALLAFGEEWLSQQGIIFTSLNATLTLLVATALIVTVGQDRLYPER